VHGNEVAVHVDMNRTPPAILPSRAEQLKRLLEEQRDRVLREMRHRIREMRGGAHGEPGEVFDEAETSEADMQTALDFALLQMYRETLLNIEAALEELDRGTYGRCQDCGHEIATARLRALPFATRCRECAASHERDVQHSDDHVRWQRLNRTLNAAA
jgi:DnaK suppressor protein